MNTRQRIVLIVGAAAFVYAMFTSPKISIVNGTYVVPPANRKDIARTVDIRAAMTRAIAVLGATVLVSVALKDREKSRIEPTPDRDPLAGDNQENKREPVGKDLVVKIIEFLREFF